MATNKRNMNTKDLAIIIQGPANNVEELKQAWKGFDVIWSTWLGSEHNFTKDDIVIFNDVPIAVGVQNIALQQKSTMEGVKKARELGFKRVVKWRSDLLPSNANRLVKLFKKDKLNFLAWHNEGKYFVDYFLEASVEDMMLAWNLPTIEGPFSERIITDNILSNIKTECNFILEDLDVDNEIFWMKYGIILSTYKDTNVYTNKIIL